ncbi:hypothetical protein ACJW31_01G286600 [Castanea mollissima]
MTLLKRVHLYIFCGQTYYARKLRREYKLIQYSDILTFFFFFFFLRRDILTLEARLETHSVCMFNDKVTSQAVAPSKPIGGVEMYKRTQLSDEQLLVPAHTKKYTG